MPLLPNWPPSTRNSQGRGRQGGHFIFGTCTLCGLSVEGQRGGGASVHHTRDWTLLCTSRIFSTCRLSASIKLPPARHIPSLSLSEFSFSLHYPSRQQGSSRAAASGQCFCLCPPSSVGGLSFLFLLPFLFGDPSSRVLSFPFGRNAPTTIWPSYPAAIADRRTAAGARP